MVIHVLTNETYTGTWYFGKTKMIDDGKKRKPKTKCGLGKQVPRSRDEWIPVEVPQIIDPDTFARAIKRKEELHVQRGGHAVKEYLMKSHLTCSKCGYAMRGQFVRRKHQYYLCNGRRQVVSLCDMPSIRGDWVDAVVWEWAKMIIESPENLRVGLDDVQKELEQENQSLFNRLGIIEEQMTQYQSQLDKLLDLYLDGNFPKEVLTERKSRLEELLFNLGKEKNDLLAHVRHVTMTDEQLNYIEGFCAKIRKGLDRVDFNTKRQIIELLDIRGKVAFENGQKVLYLKCLIDPINSEEHLQRLPMQISPSLCCHNGTPYMVTARLVLPNYGRRTGQKRKKNSAPCRGAVLFNQG
ncbi:MAG: hypothetical protein HND47_24885 [Chloroflexi bacterium]|nr:hypothetical protein [Chloroflexota bacterium]